MLQHPIHWLISTPAGSVIFLVIGLLLLALLYLLPSIIAFSLESSRPGLLLIVNLLLGWTVIGWIACLIWALITSTYSDTFDEQDRKEPYL